MWVGKCVGKAHAVHRILLEPVHDLRWLDADDLVERRHDVVDVVKLRSRRLVRPDAFGPGYDHGVARAAEVRGDEFRVVERRIAGPCPARVIHVVGLRAAEGIQAAEFVEGRELLLDRVGDAILGEQFADGAVLALGAGAVVAEDVDDDRIVADAEAIEFIDHLAGLRIDVLDKAGKDFHQAALEGAFRFGDAVPTGHRFVAQRKLRVGRDPAHIFLPLENALAVGVPAIVELAFVLVRPLLEDVMRSVSCAGGPIQKNGLSAENAWWCRNQVTAFSARSSLR